MQLIEINAAVTLLMDDAQRTAKMELSRIIQYQNKLYQSIGNCFREQLRNLGHVPARLGSPAHYEPQIAHLTTSELDAQLPSFWPPSGIIKWIDRRFTALNIPHDIGLVRQLAEDIEQDVILHDDRYLHALTGLFEAGRRGAVRFYGRRRGAQDKNTLKRILLDYFEERITIGRDRTTIGLNPSTGPLHFADLTADETTIHGVHVSLFDVQNMTLKSGRRPEPDRFVLVDDSEIAEWHRGLQRPGENKTEQELVKEARARFGRIKDLRARLRAIKAAQEDV